MIYFIFYIVIGLGLMALEEMRDPTPEGFFVRDIPMLCTILLMWPLGLLIISWMLIRKKLGPLIASEWKRIGSIPIYKHKSKN